MKLKRLSLFFVFLVFLFIPLAYANDENVNIDEFDDQLSERMNIPLFAAQLLSASLFLIWFLFPGVLIAKDNVSQSFMVVIVGLPIMGFCIAMGWLPTWLLLITCLLIALMFAGKVRGFISGGD